MGDADIELLIDRVGCSGLFSFVRQPLPSPVYMIRLHRRQRMRSTVSHTLTAPACCTESFRQARALEAVPLWRRLWWARGAPHHGEAARLLELFVEALRVIPLGKQRVLLLEQYIPAD
jgi:hypothetical protein